MERGLSSAQVGRAVPACVGGGVSFVWSVLCAVDLLGISMSVLLFAYKQFIM